MKVLILFMSALFLMHCSNPAQESTAIQNGGNGNPADSSGGKLTLVDETGKVWDITDAVRKHNFSPSLFRFGLGPDAIRPINNPQFLSAGSSEFPSSNETFRTIGFDFQSDPRAYPLYLLNSHEVVNDQINAQPFAAVY